MAKNRVFFPQQALDLWVHENRVELSRGELVIRAEGRRYRIVEAMRVLAEVTGQVDANELVGKVETVAFLVELGAELLGTSMIIGDSAYDVVPGWVGTPVGTFDQHLADPARLEARARSAQIEPKGDAELLAQYLVRTLE